ncbi:hypothetical protein EVAR_89864_1 [Eumeta japonica]|uniref:Uncharacterized protein n=1 Tax=Eumeta variegata TaxID=151549 RepID=A0A4C1ZTV1_EUMVA|nr:hypothetical protein EVAR_89864_1 [Eumeta japonica]
MRSFLPRAVGLRNDLQSAGFPTNKGVFDDRAYLKKLHKEYERTSTPAHDPHRTGGTGFKLPTPRSGIKYCAYALYLGSGLIQIRPDVRERHCCVGTPSHYLMPQTSFIRLKLVHSLSFVSAVERPLLTVSLPTTYGRGPTITNGGPRPRPGHQSINCRAVSRRDVQLVVTTRDLSSPAVVGSKSDDNGMAEIKASLPTLMLARRPITNIAYAKCVQSEKGVQG